MNNNITVPVHLHVGTNVLALGEISGADHVALSKALAHLLRATGDAMDEVRAEREQVPA